MRNRDLPRLLRREGRVWAGALTIGVVTFLILAVCPDRLASGRGAALAAGLLPRRCRAIDRLAALGGCTDHHLEEAGKARQNKGKGEGRKTPRRSHPHNPARSRGEGVG
jgi:hypothetical protein